jgi:hypothetical protein
MLILKEQFIYHKIADNSAPYWELYTVSGFMRSTSPVDVYAPPADMPDDKKIEMSIAKLRSILDIYRENTASGEAPQFHIAMRRSERSHSGGKFEYDFLLDLPQNDNQPQLSGLAGMLPQGLEGFVPRSVADAERELLKKEILLAAREERLNAREQELNRREQEIEEKAKPWNRTLEKAAIKVAEYFVGEESSQTGLAGTDDSPNTPEAQKVEQIAQFLYDNFDMRGLEYVEKYIHTFKNKLYEVSKDKQAESNTDATAETTAAQ